MQTTSNTVQWLCFLAGHNVCVVERPRHASKQVTQPCKVETVLGRLTAAVLDHCCCAWPLFSQSESHIDVFQLTASAKRLNCLSTAMHFSFLKLGRSEMQRYPPSHHWSVAVRSIIYDQKELRRSLGSFLHRYPCRYRKHLGLLELSGPAQRWS